MLSGIDTLADGESGDFLTAYCVVMLNKKNGKKKGLRETMTPWQIHKKKWQGCQRCSLSGRRKRVVLARGKIPCNVLFVGEAPGHSEDVVGTPFVGPAGRLMQRIIDRSLDGQYDYALTNLVACVPLEDGNNKLRDPPEECVEACEPRLEEFMDVAVPDVVIAVGGLAERYLVSADDSIVHPAAMLRMDPGQKSLAIQRAIAIVSDAVHEVFEKSHAEEEMKDCKG